MNRALAAFALAAALAAPSCASDDADEDLGAQTYIHNAQGYAEGGHYDQALAQFRRALEISPSDSKALLGEATCLYWLGVEDTPAGGQAILEAEEKFEALDPDAYGENSWKIRLTRGLVHARLADLWERKAALARGTAAGGSDPEAAARVREAEARGEEHGKRADADLRAVLAAEDQPLARNNLTALFSLARASAMRAKDVAGYDEVLGLLGRYLKEVVKSRDLWLEMKKREPKLEGVYEEKHRTAVRLEVDLRDLIANIHFKRHDHEASIAELDQVLKLDPYRAAAFFNRGQSQEELGRFGAAADDYRRFLRVTDLGPGSPQVVEATERMTRCEARVREKMGQ